MAISAEIFPSAARGTAAGVSAAFGKLGATIGSYVFSELKNLGLSPFKGLKGLKKGLKQGLKQGLENGL